MLVAAPERWDEACFAVPALRALAASGLRVGVLCREEQRGFWETLEGLAVVDFPAKTKAKVVAAQIFGKWEASLALEPGMAAEVFKIAKIPRRLGTPGLKKLLTHPLGFATRPLEHRVRHYLAPVEELGVATDRPEFFAPAALGIESVSEGVLLAPDSDFGANHEWPLERWVEIAEKIRNGGRRLRIASTGEGRGLGKLLAEKVGGELELFDPAVLAGALPILATYSLVISADSSLPHLAAHAGATCLTLFGPNDPVWRRPLGKRHAIVRRHVECAPCLLPKCPLDLRCQHELDVDRVWAALRDKLGIRD